MSTDPKSKDQNGSEPPSENAEPYKVGRGKPPLEGQFKKGNKVGKGRPKGAKGLKRIVNEAFHQSVSAKVGDKVKKISRIEATIHQVAIKGSKGDPKAAEKGIALYQQYGPQDEDEGPPAQKLSRDRATLRLYLGMLDYLDPDDEDDDG